MIEVLARVARREPGHRPEDAPDEAEDHASLPDAAGGGGRAVGSIERSTVPRGPSPRTSRAEYMGFPSRRRTALRGPAGAPRSGASMLGRGPNRPVPRGSAPGAARGVAARER